MNETKLGSPRTLDIVPHSQNYVAFPRWTMFELKKGNE